RIFLLLSSLISPPPTSTLFPYTTLFRSLLIEQEPIARGILHVVRGRGEIRADRPRLELAHHRGKLVSAAKRDPAPARRIHAAERLGPMPRRRERRDAAAAAARDAAIVAIGREVERVFLRDEGQ